uniref:Uncharacterized protein n=1 Tax=Anguilla anguilla TaxID=7936 RepID=A0A0E9T5Q9_ANGAN
MELQLDVPPESEILYNMHSVLICTIEHLI